MSSRMSKQAFEEGSLSLSTFFSLTLRLTCEISPHFIRSK
ncbi:hypothetical protein HMPREF0077_1932 [Anaerococcus tetradius ATCC 35098]|uniref:Uncharacterized protein n=1 Tax=Anaerococcus tetradius ATCC 35098 TaxID=525255 RepID=C2CKC2_9FIRM|nr:hypothetical protein HMPREF0077_1932 [Anaerococcus tetradius ATCC 35098]